jgi:hypothetical protein
MGREVTCVAACEITAWRFAGYAQDNSEIYKNGAQINPSWLLLSLIALVRIMMK